MSSPVDHIRKLQQELTAIRRDIHAHPELAFEERRTSQMVAEKLAGWGIEVHRGLAKTGVVGVIRGRGSRHGDRGIVGMNDSQNLPLGRSVFDAELTVGSGHR